MPADSTSEGLILIVDDDHIVRIMMRAELEQEGYTVLEAVDGEEAYLLSTEQCPDIIIVDAVMPRMDGFELCRTLRRQSSTAFVPILMATGLGNVESIARAYEAGATDFIAKPITWVMLIHRIRYMLRAGRAFAEVRENQERLLGAIEAAESANRSRTEFLANMSHELRTPLNAIIGFSDLISHRANGPIADKYIEYVMDISQSAMHLLSVINDVLDYAKAEVRELALIEQNLDIASVVTVAAQVVAESAQKVGIEYNVEIEEKLPLFRGDAGKLRQILISLLGNAVKFTAAGGMVSLVVGREPEGGLYFLVRDTGIGIPPEKMQAALAPFGQADGSMTRLYGGSGLGLPLSLALVELHGGRLTLTSVVGKGTDAKASFPVERFVQPSSPAVFRSGVLANRILSSPLSPQIQDADD